MGGLGLSDSLVWPLALVAAGVVLLSGSTFGLAEKRARLAAVALIVVGIVIFVGNNTRGTASTLLAPGAVGVALLLVLAPWAWRLAREREAERAARIRTEERADFAARVHDSVLQTLTLIQKEPADARRLARRQERELRAWLYPDRAATAEGTLAGAVESAAAEIEELHGVRVEVVRTGDAPLDDRAQALVLAAREAMANAARHSGVDEVSVFLDAGDAVISLYVRDRGTGFDPEAVAADRRGLAESIRGRMERVGGSARIVSAPGEGTDVELVLRGRRLDGARQGSRLRRPAGMSRPLRRVVLVDDHDLFRAGVRAGLEKTVEVVGEAGSVADAVPLIKELDPDVVLLDVHLPDGGGHAVIMQVAQERPGVKFLALSVSDAAEDVIVVIRAGARGYVTKAISGTELTEAVHRVADGDAVFSPRLAGFVLDAFPRRRDDGRSGARPAHAARARGPAADRARLPLQGDRGAAASLAADGRVARVGSAAQAPALLPARADALGRRATLDLVERGVAGPRLGDAGLRRADDGGPRRAQVEIVVADRGDEGADRRAEVVDPALAPEVAEQLRAERARRVHRGAGEGAAHEHVHRDREPDREAGDRLERAARIDGGRVHGPDEEEREDDLDDEAFAGAEASRVRHRADELRVREESAQDCCGDERAAELRDPVHNREARRDAARRQEAERDRRVEVRRPRCGRGSTP